MSSIAKQHDHLPVTRRRPRPPRGWRRALQPGWLRVPWMMALFFGIGLGLILLVRWAEGWDPLWSWRPIITAAFLTALPIGFLAGIGGFAAAVLFAAWVAVELRSRVPLVDVRLMRTPVVWWTNISALLFGFGMYSMMVVLPEFMEAPRRPATASVRP